MAFSSSTRALSPASIDMFVNELCGSDEEGMNHSSASSNSVNAPIRFGGSAMSGVPCSVVVCVGTSPVATLATKAAYSGSC